MRKHGFFPPEAAGPLEGGLRHGWRSLTICHDGDLGCQAEVAGAKGARAVNDWVEPKKPIAMNPLSATPAFPPSGEAAPSPGPNSCHSDRCPFSTLPEATASLLFESLASPPFEPLVEDQDLAIAGADGDLSHHAMAVIGGAGRHSRRAKSPPEPIKPLDSQVAPGL